MSPENHRHGIIGMKLARRSQEDEDHEEHQDHRLEQRLLETFMEWTCDETASCSYV